MAWIHEECEEEEKNSSGDDKRRTYNGHLIASNKFYSLSFSSFFGFLLHSFVVWMSAVVVTATAIAAAYFGIVFEGTQAFSVVVARS